jgi:hypothetical protein
MKGNGSETNCATEALHIQRNLARTQKGPSDGDCHVWQWWCCPPPYNLRQSKCEFRVLPQVSGESFASSRATKATAFQYGYSTTYDAQKCTLPCDKTWEWASGIVEVGTSNTFPTFQTRVLFLLLHTSGLSADAPDAPQPLGLLCYPEVFFQLRFSWPVPFM